MRMTWQSLAPDGRVEALRAVLAIEGFSGDFEDSRGARQVGATDNSIYEVLPAAIVYPAEGEDLNRIVRATLRQEDRLSLTARGGNTGTNGQSLNDGVIIDLARHMNHILYVDAAAMTVTVEPGVVLEQLNVELSRHGLLFPPTTSTATRATIGGMVATDASGKGSRIYGKTSDYIVAMDIVLADGSDWRVEPMTRHGAEAVARGVGLLADMHRETLRVVTEQAAEIAVAFPVMNRGLTGYNLQKTYDAAADRFSLAYLLAGSEGTLALFKTITLRVVVKPAVKALAIVSYDDFDAGLRDVERLLEAEPLAIEILDDRVLGVAKTDIVWSGIAAVLGDRGTATVKALGFIEYAGSSAKEVDDGLARLQALLDRPSAGMIDARIARDPVVIGRLWTLREKSVGLLGRLGGGRQGIPFVEDTAVPPSKLADYVAEFRALLDSYDLQYGMFGHADVGCLHVRPFLDMTDPAQAALVRPISDGVAALVKRYGGLLWGEHGRGFRGEYSPFFFGPGLYAELGLIKMAFDPDNLFNPGKLASPEGHPALDKIDDVPFRGALDRQISAELIEEFDRAVACNGNGACFSWNALDTMCPSYKATRDRAQSPKGRAALLRGWSRLQSNAMATEQDYDDIENALNVSLKTCLSCKACTTLCPVQVDIPLMKSRFLARYHSRHARPVRHRLLGRMEELLAIGRTLPRLANALGQSAPMRRLLRRYFGLVDLPTFSNKRWDSHCRVVTTESLRSIDRDIIDRTIVLVEDGFTASFDRSVPVAAAALLTYLGYDVRRLPPRRNGKLLHLLGMRDRFARIAAARVAEYAQIAAIGVRLVGLDAATSLMFEQEYREFVTDFRGAVIGVETLLADDIAAGRLVIDTPHADKGRYRLLGHCTGTALRPDTLAKWVNVLGDFGLTAEPVRTGCCGMAGLFGHEAETLAISRRLFDLSWRDAVAVAPDAVLATGYSCRSQTKRLAGIRLLHPVELLAAHLLTRAAA